MAKVKIFLSFEFDKDRTYAFLLKILYRVLRPKLLIRKRDAFVEVLQGHFALDGRKRQNFITFLEIAKNPLLFLAEVVVNTNLVLGDKDVFLQGWKLAIVREFLPSVIRFG